MGADRKYEEGRYRGQAVINLMLGMHSGMYGLSGDMGGFISWAWCGGWEGMRERTDAGLLADLSHCSEVSAVYNPLLSWCAGTS